MKIHEVVRKLRAEGIEMEFRDMSHLSKEEAFKELKAVLKEHPGAIPDITPTGCRGIYI